jgi:hypothetical protein
MFIEGRIETSMEVICFGYLLVSKRALRYSTNSVSRLYHYKILK